MKNNKDNKLNVLRLSKFAALIGALTGVVAGLIYSIGGLIIDLNTTGLNKGTTLAFLAIPGMPLHFAAIGFIATLIGGYLYNLLIANNFKNISLDFKK